MWSWIYRIIAALLALVGGSGLTIVARGFQNQAHQISLVFGQSALLLVVMVASALLAASVMILISPTRRLDSR
jgi:hypothetical protein